MSCKLSKFFIEKTKAKNNVRERKPPKNVISVEFSWNFLTYGL